MKAYTIKMNLAMPDSKLPTNTIKKYVTGLIKAGNLGIVADVTFKPVTYTDPIVVYLLNKTPYKFYALEIIVIYKKNKTGTGETITPNLLMERFKELMPLLTDKNTDKVLNIEVLSIQVNNL